MARNPLSATSRALIASSLGLPGFTELMAQESGEDAFEYRFNHYEEEPLPADRLAGGEASRYVIKSHQLRLREVLNSQFSLEIDGLHESMSGSSPWFVMPDPDQGPMQFMSGATIRESRDQLGLSLTRREAGRSDQFGLSWSTENDYDALAAAYTGSLELASGHSTLSWGVSHSDDRLSPTDAALFDRIAHARKNSTSLSFSVSRIINRNTLLQAGVQHTRQRGFLSDPYKLVWVDGILLADARPDRRQLFSFNARLRVYMQQTSAALHVNYRYFNDDWGIRAHTAELAWHQPFREHWTFAPSLRVHAQGAADFYATHFEALPANGWATSDYRQSGYGARSLRMSVTYQQQDWLLRLHGEWYDSSESGSLDRVRRGTPGLVDFQRFGVGLERRW